MDILEVVRINLLSPMVLAFALGIIATLISSDLQIPDQIYTIISIYLLFAIGLKGGFDLARSPLQTFWAPALAAAGLGMGIAAWSYAILRRLGRFPVPDAAALAIHYSAVSAVTLSACVAFLTDLQQPYEGFMPTLYAVMEIPAVITALLIAGLRLEVGRTWRQTLRSALSGASVLLLGGGVVIGFISGEAGYKQVAPFFVTLFPGVLALFLLEMGMVVGRQLSHLREVGRFLIGFGLIMPLFHGALGVILGTLAGLSAGGSTVMAALAASASYITAPALVRATLPQANPSYYLTAALVITFPFNLTIGLPLYYEFALLISRLAL